MEAQRLIGHDAAGHLHSRLKGRGVQSFAKLVGPRFGDCLLDKIVKYDGNILSCHVTTGDRELSQLISGTRGDLKILHIELDVAEDLCSTLKQALVEAEDLEGKWA